MTVVRLVAPCQWEVIVEIKKVFGSAREIAARLRKDGYIADVIGAEVHVLAERREEHG